MSDEISGVFLVVDENLHSRLHEEDLEEWGAEAAQNLAGDRADAVRTWLKEHDQTVTVVVMEGEWDDGRIDEVVAGTFGQLGQVSHSGPVWHTPGAVDGGRAGLVISYSNRNE